jgi:16S rRNA (cytosine1402-N4)-methyltransferase
LTIPNGAARRPSQAEHEPVLYDEVMAALAPRPGGRYIDATVGAGGDARGILELSAPDGRLLGIDEDMQALQVARRTLADYGARVTLVHGSFGQLAALARQQGFCPADGVLLDVGVSSMQLSAPERGFSWMATGPLDMRMDPDTMETTAADLVNTLPEGELADILYRYGEERMSRRIARDIVRARPLHTTTELADLIARTVGRRGRIHAATRSFQGLRVAVNNELEALAEGLRQGIEVLAPGARLVLISFHSLEDRLAKHYFRQLAHSPSAVRLLTLKPVRPSLAEQERNPRSRSAKLRAVEKSSSAPLNPGQVAPSEWEAAPGNRSARYLNASCDSSQGLRWSHGQ